MWLEGTCAGRRTHISSLSWRHIPKKNHKGGTKLNRRPAGFQPNKSRTGAYILCGFLLLGGCARVSPKGMACVL